MEEFKDLIGTSYGFGVIDEFQIIEVAKNIKVNYYPGFGMDLFEFKRYREDYAKEKEIEENAGCTDTT